MPTRKQVDSPSAESEPDLERYWLCGDYLKKRRGVHYFYKHKYVDYRVGEMKRYYCIECGRSFWTKRSFLQHQHDEEAAILHEYLQNLNDCLKLMGRLYT